ncbi:MAG TPA: hypothetical protein PLZ73_00485 [bacterium]|nr:hypothetical protein [bacterium]
MKSSLLVLLVVIVVMVAVAVGYVLLGPEPALPTDTRSRQDHLRALNTAGLVRSAVSAYYWEQRSRGGPGAYPEKLEGSMFDGGKVPDSTFGIYHWSYDRDSGEVSVGISGYGRARLKLLDLLRSVGTFFTGAGKDSE